MILNDHEIVLVSADSQIGAYSIMWPLLRTQRTTLMVVVMRKVDERS